MHEFSNPFRPGAGHTPPYLAGRQAEREAFLRLLGQSTILDNMILTGLRGVGKTVLLESFKPLAISNGWLWVGADLSESASFSEDNLAISLCADVSLITSEVAVGDEEVRKLGFAAEARRIRPKLGYEALRSLYERTPGLSLDKLKFVLEFAWTALSKTRNARGIIFAYDEAQNLGSRSAKQECPLSLLLDAFQSLQGKGLPLMLVLTGRTTLFPRLIEARTFSERMFKVVRLQNLSGQASEEAIRKPIDNAACPLRLADRSVRRIVNMSGGYPYFIQFICREVYDAFIQRVDRGEGAFVPVGGITQKLDTDFFAGWWARTTDRQRALLAVISRLDSCEDEFTLQQVSEGSQGSLDKPFSRSHVNQLLAALATQGLVSKSRHGKYSLSVPLLGQFIRRQVRA